MKPPEWFTRTDEEDELVALYGLSDDQLYWRRVQIAEVDGDVSLFKQEYPATDIEAFQASGNSHRRPTSSGAANPPMINPSATRYHQRLTPFSASFNSATANDQNRLR